MKKNIIIIILSIGILGLGGYIGYDKFLNQLELKDKEQSKNEKVENNQKQEEKIEQKDIGYFKDYLYYFMPEVTASHFLKNIDTFSEDDIRNYIFYYYSNQVNQGKLEADVQVGEYDGTFTYTVSKEEVAKLVNKYFGIENFMLTEDSKGRSGVKRINDNIYQIYWFATGWFSPECELTSVVYNGKNVKVTGKIYKTEETDFKENSEIIFNLVYNNGNYNLKSIEYSEENR